MSARPRLRLWIAFWLGLVMLAWLGASDSAAQAPNRAGLVVQHGDGTVRVACVTFEEPEISGAELLRRSGLDVVVAVESGLMVCAIEGEGCQYPAEPCFCQCQGQGPCTYWSYWHLDSQRGEWAYSSLGAGAYKVRNGDVDGWRWGSGTPGRASAPPVMTFEEVCGPPSLQASPTPAPTASPAASPTPTNSLRVMPSVTPAPPPPAATRPRFTPTVAPTPTPASVEEAGETAGPSGTDYLFFLVIGLFLIGGAFLTARRRRPRWEQE